MNVSIYIEPIKRADELIKLLLNQEFGISDVNSNYIYEYRIKKHFERLNDSLYLVAETNYVDKVYRDSYYHYYSSKLSPYKRNCVRISLFSDKIDLGDFRNEEQKEKLQALYLGFIVLRPNEPYIIGRSVISPSALKEKDFCCCITTFHNTVNSVKLTVEGFPHSSQDTETLACAETTLWALMEYFSHRYPEYKPTLPSKIVKTLSQMSFERQIPSKGLNIQQMSFALKEFGFGSRIYGESQFGTDFNLLLSCYIESGIPLIIAMENSSDGGTIGHALLCVGHEKVTDEMIDKLSEAPITSKYLRETAASSNIKFYDYDSVSKRFLFIDDNHPVYQKAFLDYPATHYEKAWHNCKISYFIAPLYPKIHLDAFEAKNFVNLFVVTGPAPLVNGTNILLRVFLTSSRSFKDKLAFNKSFSNDVKDLILEMAMPKFIWVAELSTKELIKNAKANGLIIFDATEANTYDFKPLIIAAYQSKVINFEEHNGKIEIKNIPLNEFSIFENNLRPC